MKRSESIHRRLLLGALVCALPALAAAQTVTGQEGSDDSVTVPDSTMVVDMALATADSGAVMLPAAAALEPIDVWSTGVSPTAAVLMTPLFPGWGQLYTENSWRAALAFGLEMFYWSNLIMHDRRAVRARDFDNDLSTDDPNKGKYYDLAQENWEQMRDFAWWSGGVLLIIALDAYVGAHLYDFEQDPVPVPNRWDDHFGPPGGDMPGSHSAPSLVIWQHGWRF